MTNRQMLAMQDKFLVQKFFFIFNVYAQYYLLQFAVLSKPFCLQETNSISGHLVGLTKTVLVTMPMVMKWGWWSTKTVLKWYQYLICNDNSARTDTFIKQVFDADASVVDNELRDLIVFGAVKSINSGQWWGYFRGSLKQFSASYRRKNRLRLPLCSFSI